VLDLGFITDELETEVTVGLTHHYTFNPTRYLSSLTRRSWTNSPQTLPYTAPRAQPSRIIFAACRIPSQCCRGLQAAQALGARRSWSLCSCAHFRQTHPRCADLGPNTPVEDLAVDTSVSGLFRAEKTTFAFRKASWADRMGIDASREERRRQTALSGGRQSKISPDFWSSAILMLP
jgi:hypothetical protein